MSIWLQIVIIIAILFMIVILATFVGMIVIYLIEYIKNNKKKGKDNENKT